jgi:hypothetical protein
MSDKNYIKKFWVGLMDGDGSIQVNHWRKKYLQYRIVLKLKDTNKNSYLLNLIKAEIGGKIRKVKSKNQFFILWVVDSKKTVFNIIKIFDDYPPLTFRMQAQLKFLKDNIRHNNNILLYLEERVNKYKNFTSSQLRIDYNYFYEWLSGFIEAEGCFCVRKSKNNSFSIGQNTDKDLLNVIKIYFDVTGKLRSLKKENYIFFFFETYNKKSFQIIFNHFLKYPLLGEKLISFEIFKTQEYKQSVM